ncbi:MAG: hypothetical protein WAV25_00165 [Minisyncoccia bacterium]
MPNRGILADEQLLLGQNIQEKLDIMFGAKIGKKVYMVGWDRLNKLTNQHPILPLPGNHIMPQLNKTLFMKLDEIETSQSGKSRRAAAEHVLELYIDILCDMFPRV